MVSYHIEIRENAALTSVRFPALTRADSIEATMNPSLHELLLPALTQTNGLSRVLPYWPPDRYLELAPQFWRTSRSALSAAPTAPLNTPRAPW
jgi:hypothetical protein